MCSWDEERSISKAGTCPKNVINVELERDALQVDVTGKCGNWRGNIDDIIRALTVDDSIDHEADRCGTQLIVSVMNSSPS